MKGFRPAKGWVAEIHPRWVFLLRYGLQKLTILNITKMTWAWPKNNGDAAPYQAIDEDMK
jgi:hypothetical protein